MQDPLGLQLMLQHSIDPFVTPVIRASCLFIPDMGQWCNQVLDFNTFPVQLGELTKLME